MKRSDLHELHYITPIQNVPSIMEHGLLCLHEAKRLNHTSVAMQEIQEIRAKITIPGGKPLHSYVNLYICARNPMMYKRAAQHKSLCVLRVSPEVLDLPGVVIADGNAASAYTGFWPSELGFEKIDLDLVFAESGGQIIIKSSNGTKPVSSARRSWCPRRLILALSRVRTFRVRRARNYWRNQASDW